MSHAAGLGMEKETCHILLMAVCDLWPVAKVEGWKVRPKIGKKERKKPV